MNAKAAPDTLTAAPAEDLMLFKGRVTETLTEAGFDANFWHTGGGIHCIAVQGPIDSVFLNFGDEDGFWGCDACDAETGDSLDWYWLGEENGHAVSRNARDASAVVDCIRAGMAAYQAHAA